MKLLVLLSCLIAHMSAQRPSFAGLSPKGVPEVASRFKTDSDEDKTLGGGLANRGGFADGTSSSNTPKIPVDARGDVDLVNRINQWPRENQPFWFINAEHIERHRNQGANNANRNGQQTQAFSNQNNFDNSGNGFTTGQQNSDNFAFSRDQQTISSRNSYDDEVVAKKPTYAKKPVQGYGYHGK